MAFIKPSITQTRPPAEQNLDTETGQAKPRGKIQNPPFFTKLGGFDRPGKVKKNNKAVTDRGGAGKGPYNLEGT